MGKGTEESRESVESNDAESGEGAMTDALNKLLVRLGILVCILVLLVVLVLIFI